MKKFKTHQYAASALMQDDRFRMGGKMYRITALTANQFGDLIISARPTRRNREESIALIVPMDVRFKVYNQK